MYKLFVLVSLLISVPTLAQFESDLDSSSTNSYKATVADTVVKVQDTGLTHTDSILFSAAYQFRDGIYLSRKAFLDNQPITIDKILSTVPFTDPDFYEKTFMTGGFKVQLPDGKYQYHGVEEVFGFVQNRVFYINLGQAGFARMSNFGKICYLSFSTSEKRIQPTAGVGMNSWGGASVGVGVQINGNAASIREFIFRIEGGPIVEFTPEMLLEFIKDDEILFNTYVGMNKRYRLKEMHNYLNEYNRRNPLYLPIYK